MRNLARLAAQNIGQDGEEGSVHVHPWSVVFVVEMAIDRAAVNQRTHLHTHVLDHVSSSSIMYFRERRLSNPSELPQK